MSRRFLTPVNLPKGNTLPSVGSAGDLFYKLDEQKIYVHNGTTWVIAQGSPGGSVFEVSATPPLNPTEGATWYNSTDGSVYVYYDGQWVDTSVGVTGPTGPTGPAGADSTVPGPTGPAGADGVGIPAGGTVGQILAKIDDNDYNTEWVNNEGGGASALSELTDATIADPIDGHTLLYSEATNKWVNVSFAEILASFGLITGDGGSYNTTEFTGTIDGGLYNTTLFMSVVDGGNEGSF